MADAMAANSGGIDWSTFLKPFLSLSSDVSSKTDLLNLCTSIVKSKSEILSHKESNKKFYDHFAILSANYISYGSNDLSAKKLEIICAACQVLLKYILDVLHVTKNELSTSQILQYLNTIKVLCTGKRYLTPSEYSTLVETMKGETFPQNYLSTGCDKESNKPETSKNRSNLFYKIAEQLTLPLRDENTTVLEESASVSTRVQEIYSDGDPVNDINKLFLEQNVETLQALRAGETLLDLCLSLTSIKKAKAKIEEALAGKSFVIPTNHNEALSVRNSLSSTLMEINLISSAINLPILEPLNSTKIDDLCNLSMACLYCAVGQASASAILSSNTVVSPKNSNQQPQTCVKEDDLDSNAIALVEEVLKIYKHIGKIIKESTKAGGHIYQNYKLAGSWILISGIQTHLASSMSSDKSTHLRERDEKGRSPCKTRESTSSRSTLQKFQQSFGVLSVALATKALSLLSELFSDLRIEISCGSSNIAQVEPALITAVGNFTALQRVAKISVTTNLIHLFFYVAIVSCRKGSSLRRLHPPEGDTFSQSDSTTYYEDMIMCSDEGSTDEDDDSEPILGQWFEETLAPPETTDTKSFSTSENIEPKSTQADRTHSIVPEKGEAHGYISLATSIFVFLNKYFLCSKSVYISKYVKNGLTEQQMIILASIVRDLDKEMSKTEMVYFGTTLGQLYCEFSGALTRFTHNLITNSNLNHLQACLLNHLGVSPWNADAPHAWPLQVYPRTLSVLTQVLLLRPQNEKEASVISIWHRLVNTLIENVLNVSQSVDIENEDLNVEHAQVLLYLFHFLNLTQKKSVLLLMAGGILRCSEVAHGPLKDSQFLQLSRLLLLFDYVMKHLYDAPSSLLEQMEWNLFYSTHVNTNKESDSLMSRMYSVYKNIEENYRKISVNDEFAMKPRFYILTNLEINNQDAPKLDGLACHFIVGSPDKLQYPLLIDALIEILNITHVTSGANASKMSFLGLCATQYCFTICWRLLLLLPPSDSYLERLASGVPFTAEPRLLHTLIWGPRTAHKNFSRWLRDCLIKQGTQNGDKILKAISDAVNNVKHDVANAKNCITALTPDIKKGIITTEDLPPIWHIFLLDSLLAKVQISLEDSEEGTSEVLVESADNMYAQDLLPHVLYLTQCILHCTKWSLLHSMVEQKEGNDNISLQDMEGIQDVLAICSLKNTLTNFLAHELISLLPNTLSSLQLQNNTALLTDISLHSFMGDIIPSESYILKIIDAHLSTLSMNNPFSINYSLKRLLQCLIKFICDHAPRTENTDTKNKAIETLVCITLDLRTEFLFETVIKTLDKMIGDNDTDEHQKRVYLRVLHHIYRLIVNCTLSNNDNYGVLINEKVLYSCLKFYEKIIEKASGRQALESFFTGDKDLVKVLMSVSNPQMSQQYSTKVLHFFNKLFQAAEKSSTDPSLNHLCCSIGKLANVEKEKLETWLKHIIIGPSYSDVTAVILKNKSTSDNGKWSIASVEDKEIANSSSCSEIQKSTIEENSQLLQALTRFIIKQNSDVSEEISITILKALIQLGSKLLSPALEGAGFTDLMIVMTMLADAGSGKGHSLLFPATAEWIELCNERIVIDEIISNVCSDPDYIKRNAFLSSSACILDYISDVVCLITYNIGQSIRPLSPPWESEYLLDVDSDWQDFTNDDDDSGEDSDEESLCNKLCTFTVTQKEFMNQHWYHCHTCKMLDGVGVCSICARVCHKGHDLSYAKFGNFFCDCGAKEDGSCQALTKRSPQPPESNPGTNYSGQCNNIFSAQNIPPSSLRRRTSSPIPSDKFTFKENKPGSIAKHIESSKDFIVSYLGSSTIAGSLLEFLITLIPIVEETCRQNSPVGCHSRGIKALEQLYSKEKQFIYTDQLMVPTLGSQEGAFENVRMSYAGEQGQTIRQLLSAHIVRRVAMCCMTSTQGRRQHLAVSHEKGKLTVLQLSALLKQADSSTRKLTLTRLSTAPIPFTVLSLSSNLCNEDFLAVCGLKDCHVLTFTSGGSVSDHLVLQPQLETGNFIIKAIWLPGSQAKLALVTADFVKIYDLSTDAINPQYFFLVPSGKIRDCTFMYEDGIYHILLMSSPGHIYTEILNEESSTKYGTFYVTNTLEIFHLDITDVNGQVAGGGVSIHYSHTLGLLFYSYAQGKSFISPILPKNNCLPLVFPINLQQSNNTTSKSNGSRNSTSQPLCQWTEIPNHPGLVCCALQSSNNPVILMLKPDAIMIQEIKIIPTKSKIMDMVAIRHSSGNEMRTTLILLCEDGSLKMYMANMEQTGFWMSPCIQPTVPTNTQKIKKKKVVKPGKNSGSVTFPVDFFEHCVAMNDVEFGGNDLLQLYNQAQLKHRLNTTGLYVACNKPLGFTLEVTNNDPSMVVTGFRVLIGSQDIQRCPSFIEVFGRIIPITTTRSRWYDIPLSREESLQSDKKITVLFGPSQDSDSVTMVDSIKVYGKTKDSFGWPEETDDAMPTAATSKVQAVVNSDVDQSTRSVNHLTKLEKLVVGILETLDGTFSLQFNEAKLLSVKPNCLTVATQLLILPTPPLIQIHSKALLSSLHSTKQQYYNYKDQALLQHVLTGITAMTTTEMIDLDAESYYRLVLIIRGIAVTRPQNLIKFADNHSSIQDMVLDDPLETKTGKGRQESHIRPKHILLQLMEVLWRLHSLNTEVTGLEPVVVQGLKHTEQIVHALVEIVHAFNTCNTYSKITIDVYLQLLLCKDPLIAFSAKQALIKVLKPKARRRRVHIPSPPHCSSPPVNNTEREEAKSDQLTSNSSHEEERTNQTRQPIHFDVDAIEAINLLEHHATGQDNPNINPLEALLGGGVSFPPIIDIPPDADDETMVELAIALSLQEHEVDGEQRQTLRNLQVHLGNENLAHQVGQSAQAQEVANFSDTTASAAGSDDEGSTAATDGSTLRTSPADQGGSAGSESGGSGVESITGEHNVSGRSSAYGDNIQEALNLASRSDTSSVANANIAITEPDRTQPEDSEVESENTRLHMLRLQLLEKLVEYLPKLKNISGARSIPFLQVVLQLTTDLDGNCDRDKTCLNSLLNVIISELQFNKIADEDICLRTKQREVQLILMRLLSVLMQRCKTSTSSSSSSKTAVIDNSTFVSRVTATALHKSDVISYCNKLLQSLLKYWRTLGDEESSGNSSGNLLKERMSHPPPDMSPFFQKQFVKDNHDVFQTYPQLLTEIALRLPYQVHRYSEVSESINNSFDFSWYNLLCDYMMMPQTPFVRRQVRKLLMFICGNKETYRQLRDLHGLRNHMKGVRGCCFKAGYKSTVDIQHSLSLPYDSLVELIEHLKYCVEVAQSRTGNWQRFCVKEDDVIQFLIRISFLLDEGVAPTILQLLQSALVVNNTRKNDSNKVGTTRKDREKSDDSSIEALFEESTCIVLVEQINNHISKNVFSMFIKSFMLETNITSVRWQAHALVQAIYKNSKPHDQELILELLWQLWPLLPIYGNKAAQFVDLLGYFSLKFTEKKEGVPLIPEYVERAVSVLRTQNKMLAHHPNTNLYALISQFVELDGYYLESDPCLVCNNPEIPFSTIKLSSIKVDSKFTTTTQIIKLLSSHTISKITLKIGDLKRTKMVKTINIFYNNKSVQAVVELKNKPALWHKAKKVNLQSGQTEVKIEFPLPIIACNLMIEYADFYENIQASSETLQCPRCSASVPANPGVCTNCGENVFQCHKCRAINYDEKDPFLCHACGFCKYAKFDFSLLAKPCCAVEPIESDDDRKKTVSNINSLLEKADRVYKQLIANKPTLESLVLKITEHKSDKKQEVSNFASGSLSNPIQSDARTQLKVNKTIQMLAQQYCTDCKTSFEELSKIIQKVLVSRKELVAYDRKHRNVEFPTSPVFNNSTSNIWPCVNNRCYGCSTAATEHCLTLLRALALNTVTRQVLCSEGLIQELVWNNLRKGNIHNQEEVRQLLCVLTKDNPVATEELCNLLMERITLNLNGHFNSSDLSTSVRHEIALLSAMVQKEDECWELKLRCMMTLFLKACEDSKSPLIMESIILPCLKILQTLMKPLDIGTKKTKDKLNDGIDHSKINLMGTTIDVCRFIEKDLAHTFTGWKQRLLKPNSIHLPEHAAKDQVHEFYLAEKYAGRWRRKVKKYFVTNRLTLDNTSWLKTVMFNPSSRLARQVACNIVELMCTSFDRKKEIINLLTHFLLELNVAGESSAEFLSLYQHLIQDVPWKQYLTIHGVLIILAKLITTEIEQLHRLEMSSLTSDLAQGYALNQLTDLLASFLDDSAIRSQYKGRLVGAVLNGYLSLKILVVQRTRLIDETQEKLLELLEEMTTGTEEETKAFMSVCIKAVEKYSLQDYLTPVFIFERLCSIIYPEENDVGEFFLTLEKDPQQEDFLQGRMLGNPYSSVEADLGPLMRDVKNKICQDCELVALLEDDNGMELLVNNKIMSLDLPVKDVYKKVWLAEGGDHEAMRVVYRMRGLLGDATEEFIESFNNKSQSDIDNEEVYKMANVLAECGGLQVMVTRLGAIQNIIRTKPLLQVLLKLFRLSVKVSLCQEVLIKPEVGAMEVFLKTLKLCLDYESDSTQAVITEQLLDIMETILSKATSKTLEVFEEFSSTFGSADYIRSLLSCISQSVVKNNITVLVHLTKILAALVYGNQEKMKILIDHFQPVLDFNKYDYDHTPDDQQKLEMFCVLTNGIEKNSIGSTFKDYIISLDIVKNALEYITMHAPCVKPTLLRTDSDELKEFISKPALKYILRFLTGLAHSHEKTQLAIANEEAIPIIHRLEQVSSDEHVGSLAENLLEALCTNSEVAKQIDAAREFTRSEKKRLAMAMREKQLGQLGMRTNDKGQVTAKSTILQQIEELGEESGLICCICREGYKYQPAKVLGLYTFTKRCNVDDYEAKSRKTVGYSTVSHFNIVHIDCHMSAVRLARARDEWESAALQNANTKCNGLLPLWGPQVPESAFASCLARHNTYLQESTNHRDIGHSSTIHDLKLLLLRFAQEKSFHEDTGGGGPQSNMHLIPYLIHVALYVINTTRVYKREEASLMAYLETSSGERWIESAYEADGPLYWITMSILLHSSEQWNVHRLSHLRRLIVIAHTRHCYPTGPVKSISDKVAKDYSVYKPYLIFFGLVDGIYKYFLKNISGVDEQWPKNLADYIRHNDEFLMKSSEKLLGCYTEELLPCSSFLEFCDVSGLLETISDPDDYINELLASLS